MADQSTMNPENHVAESGASHTSGISWWAAMAILIFAAGVGVSIPYLVPELFAQETTGADDSDLQVDDGSLNSDMTYIQFGETTVNLDEGRMNRYLRLKMSLQVKQRDRERIQRQIASKNLVLRNWLLSHLSDKTLDEIRGKAGQNMLRREIRNHFNTTLFTDGHDRIYDILFEEFNVQ